MLTRTRGSRAVRGGTHLWAQYMSTHYAVESKWWLTIQLISKSFGKSIRIDSTIHIIRTILWVIFHIIRPFLADNFTFSLLYRWQSGHCARIVILFAWLTSFFRLEPEIFCSQQQTKFVHSTRGYPARYSLGVIPVWVLKNLWNDGIDWKLRR